MGFGEWRLCELWQCFCWSNRHHSDKPELQASACTGIILLDKLDVMHFPQLHSHSMLRAVDKIDYDDLVQAKVFQSIFVRKTYPSSLQDSYDFHMFFGLTNQPHIYREF